jgi:hypothetical protein
VSSQKKTPCGAQCDRTSHHHYAEFVACMDRCSGSPASGAGKKNQTGKKNAATGK